MKDILYNKAKKASYILSKVIDLGGCELEPKNVSITLSAIPTKLNEDGSFFIMTGSRAKPEGIGKPDAPELILLYNKKGGIFLETSHIKDIIKAHRDVLSPEIDPTYSILGVNLTIGIISPYLGEELLIALHQFFEHDSLTETPA
jgi:hypothetical protein